MPIGTTTNRMIFVTIPTHGYYLGDTHLRKLVQQHHPEKAPHWIDDYLPGTLPYLNTLPKRYGYVALNNFRRMGGDGPTVDAIKQMVMDGVPVYVASTEPMPDEWKDIADKITLSKD